MLSLKLDHNSRPLWIVRVCAYMYMYHVNLSFPLSLSLSLSLFLSLSLLLSPSLSKAPDGHIFLEAFSPVYKHARDFLIAIAMVQMTNICIHIISFPNTDFASYVHVHCQFYILFSLHTAYLPTSAYS